MTRRIFAAIYVTAFFMAITCISLLSYAYFQFYTEKETEKVRIQTYFAAEALEMVGVEYLEEIASLDYRITWVDSEGDVLYDSHSSVEEMENHGNRKEIQEALETGYGWDNRQSETLLLQQIYTAIRLQDGSVLRVSNEEGTLLAFLLSMIQSLILIATIVCVLSFFIAKYVSKEIIKPLHNLDLDNPLENIISYEEITPLLSQIQRQYQNIQEHIEELARKQEEFEVITRDMEEGLLLLGPERQVLSINESACRLFRTRKEDCIGKNFLTVNRGKNLQEMLESAFSGERIENLIPIQNKQFQLSASPIMAGSVLSGVAVLLVDVTEKTETEQIRREFTANVSHELKTPLHTISGCAELLTHNLVKVDDIPQFSLQIYEEAQRLIRLVEEIISLSQLDEGAQMNIKDDVDLYSVAKEVVESLSLVAKEQKVSLKLQGDSGKMIGNYSLLSGIVHNLCENAIKYNRVDGTVELRVEKKENSIVLEVKDTGIGVSEEDMALVFQRFYRVDKSRSKEIGGTGLGLSIVKHAVSLHNGVISMESTVGKGSCITVAFPVSL